MTFKELKNKWWFGIISSIYVIILTVFVVWIVFFDANSLMIQLELRAEVKKLEKQKLYLQDEIKKDKAERSKLLKKEELERFARERYYLKKDNEEIYLIEYEDSIKTKK